VIITRARSAILPSRMELEVLVDMSHKKPLTTSAPTVQFPWLILMSTGMWPNVVTNLRIGTLALAMMLMLDAIPFCLMTSASERSSKCLSTKRIVSDMTTRSISLIATFRNRRVGFCLYKTYPVGR
jgi:Zn-dependent membrane protease YugP